MSHVLRGRSDDARLPPIPSRLSLVKLFLELSLFSPALLVLQGVMAVDDQEVEAWYLEGWCFFLMAEQAQESGGKFDELTWQELAKDARDCLEACQTVRTLQDRDALRQPWIDIFELAACQSGASGQTTAGARSRAD